MKLSVFLVCVFFAFSGLFAKNNEICKTVFELRLQGKVDQAHEILVKELQKAPSEAELHYEMAYLSYYRLMEGTQHMTDRREVEKLLRKRMHEVEKEVKTAISLDESVAKHHFLYATVLSMKAISQVHSPIHWLGIPGTLHKCKKQFKQVLELEPENDDAARMYMKLVNNKKTKKKVLQQIEQRNEVSALLAKASVGDMTKDAEIKMFINGRKKYPDDLCLNQWLALCYENIGDLENAVVFWKICQQLDANDVWSYNRLIICLKKSGRHPEAKDLLSQCIQDENVLYVKKAIALRFKARYLHSQGNKEMAEELIKKADLLDPVQYNACCYPQIKWFAQAN